MALTTTRCISIERIIANFLNRNKLSKKPIILSINSYGVVIPGSSMYFWSVMKDEEMDEIYNSVMYKETIPFKFLFGCLRPSEYNDQTLIYYKFVSARGKFEHVGPFSFGYYSIMRRQFTESFFITLTKEIIKW